MGQVRNNRESTERQYALKDKAAALGWPAQRIRVLDRDLGISGADFTTREDFKLLVADVSMNKVGAVFALEASRLSRSCSDWHRLVELCSFTGTLMMDEDGCYEPADFNDRLLLGIKGTISHAELHFIRARLHGGRMNKVRKGEYRLPLPVGFRYDEKGTVIKDADEEVRSAIALLFHTFRQEGSAQKVVRYFREKQLSFPKRSYHGVWAGKIVWGRLSENRILEVLKNPAYAGAYVYGRKRYGKRISPDGNVRVPVRRIEMPSWEVCINDHHENYISWVDFKSNQTMLENNRTHTAGNILNGPAREGAALLHGLLLCGACGHRLNVTYKGNGGIYPTYECTWKRRNGVCGSRYCLTIRSYLVDDAVCERVLKIMEPKQLEIAVKALEELQRRDGDLDKQWRMKMERADYESQLAQRRYEEVDPANRLVASTLEKRWNDALAELERARSEYDAFRAKHSLTATPEQRESVLALAKNFPRLWKLPTTRPEDRKRLLRLLIKDITVQRERGIHKAALQIRWHGGATEEISVDIPPPLADRIRCPEHVVEHIRQLAMSRTDSQIVQALEKEGMRTSRNRHFTVHCIGWIRRTHGIKPPRGDQHEITARELSKILET
jgi:DNA invertase Pin-like site-specific DNA recombinase